MYDIDSSELSGMLPTSLVDLACLVHEEYIYLLGGRPQSCCHVPPCRGTMDLQAGNAHTDSTSGGWRNLRSWWSNLSPKGSENQWRSSVLYFPPPNVVCAEHCVHVLPYRAMLPTALLTVPHHLDTIEQKPILYVYVKNVCIYLLLWFS